MACSGDVHQFFAICESNPLNFKLIGLFDLFTFPNGRGSDNIQAL